MSWISDRQRQRLKEYGKAAKQWKKDRRCAYPRCSSPHVDVHHSRGRLGDLLMDQRFWIPLCRPHHNWVGHHPQEARELGLLCPKGQWNHYPPNEHDT